MNSPFGFALTISLIGIGGIVSFARAESPREYFDPIEQDVEGWTVAVDPQLLSGEHKPLGDSALKALANHLQRITYIVPADQLAKMKGLRIWLEFEHPELKSMQYHPDRGWLIAHKHDPRLVQHVHIPQARHLIEAHTWAKHPYVILHELAHAYHDQILSLIIRKSSQCLRPRKGRGSTKKCCSTRARKFDTTG